ncbi:Ferrous-iron efflux pump FieF [Austwickia sp. TVS 96-490-7B]|uniref:cation diffusion facilitator family transporter n=1 Tax=Austwickia sp. TVS 96-490-7B TaxID=2830843 RepID=UPI001DA327EE|nr:Ferrous-iron efflux pump FieF [Austwickia sp. TVS 96-490-7B]
MTTSENARADLTRYAWLSIAAAIATIAMKTLAYLVTDSVGLLSDAAESVVNLVAAVVALIALRVAARPADDGHHFGHAKAEYFSAAVEGGMIVVAACVIVFTAVDRMIHPQPLDNVGIGLAVSVLASVINGAVAVVLMRAGKEHRSLTLSADGKHLLTDVWTSVGVVVGVLLVGITGWERLDPIVALLVGINIIVTGYQLLQQSVDGLMDVAWPEEDNTTFSQILTTFASAEVAFHAVRTREAGHQKFAEVHVLVPGQWSVQRGHDLVEDIEAAASQSFPGLQLMCHLEPLEDPRSYEDNRVYVSVDQPAGDAEQPPGETLS